MRGLIGACLSSVWEGLCNLTSQLPLTQFDIGASSKASFEEASISIGGDGFHDAFQALVLEVLDTFDYLLSHCSDLGPWPEQQLAILKRHLAKANG